MQKDPDKQSNLTYIDKFNCSIRSDQFELFNKYWGRF